ncbi:hypothetical protein L207DRAFT_505287 [Hyaloscypha variabilis F]|uniref:Uncharacterized protein n=1 Tax=Hyaloscypha variabilis (strain UAMH 11265 / GT02V1 / F) TaxID=1149755 RepID=A0A2J6SBY2_HYAVF|nr:hypothetical protein L207DRAFT_505287 [Hyaloscypha variabilis F]
MAQRNFQDRPRRESNLPAVGNQATLRDGEVDGPHRPPPMRNQMCPLYPHLFEMTPHFEVTGSRGEGQAKESPEDDTNIPRNRPASPDRKGHITPPVVSSQNFIDKLEILPDSFPPYHDEELRVGQSGSSPVGFESVSMARLEGIEKQLKDDKEPEQRGKVKGLAGPVIPSLSADFEPPAFYTLKPIVDSNQPLKFTHIYPNPRSFQPLNASSTASQAARPPRPKSPPSPIANNINSFGVISAKHIADAARNRTQVEVGKGNELREPRVPFPPLLTLPKQTPLPSTPGPDDGTNTEMSLPVSGEINASISSQPRSCHRPPKVDSMITEEMQRQIDIRSLRSPSGREWEDPLEPYMNSKILEAPFSPSLPILDPPMLPSSLAEQIKQRERSLREAEARSEKEINECLGLFSSSSHKTRAPAIVGGANVYGILNAMSKEPVPPQALGCQTVPANFNPHLATLGAGDIFGLFTEASPCKNYFSSSQPPMPPQVHAKKFPSSNINQRSGALAKDANSRMAPSPMWGMRDDASGHQSKAVPEQNTSSETQATAEPAPVNEDAEFSDVMLIDEGDQPSNAREEDEDWLVV